MLFVTVCICILFIVINIKNLGVNTVEFFSRKHTKQIPANLKCVNDASVFLIALSNKTTLKCFTKFQILLVKIRKFILTDNTC